MLASFSKTGFKPARLIRAFSKQPEIPIKYSVMTIPSLRDNYGYLISTANNNCLVIDPTNPKFVVDAVSLSKCNLKGILVTHHHLKHVLGLGEVLKEHPTVPVFGGSFADSNPEVERTLHDNEVVTLDDLEFKVIETPSHSADSLIYEFTEEVGYPVLFTGDTVMLGGIGYCPEENIDAFYSLIYDRLINYPDETCIFHGHEWNDKMLKFAQTVEPSNKWIREMRSSMRQTLLKSRMRPGTPTSLHDERMVNPFFRCNEPTIKELIGESDPKKVFAELVKRRNQFFKRRWMK